jgi:hypothetical protein
MTQCPGWTDSTHRPCWASFRLKTSATQRVAMSQFLNSSLFVMHSFWSHRTRSIRPLQASFSVWMLAVTTHATFGAEGNHTNTVVSTKLAKRTCASRRSRWRRRTSKKRSLRSVVSKPFPARCRCKQPYLRTHRDLKVSPGDEVKGGDVVAKIESRQPGDPPTCHRPESATGQG